MQTRSENLDHHQSRIPNARGLYASPEAELIALAGNTGQMLTENTLRIIREALELRCVTMTEFLADVRSHFRNNILNPSGFLINRARYFHRLSRPATVALPPAPSEAAAIESCETCHGQQYVLEADAIQPCPQCSTQEFRRDWEAREEERANKIRAARARRG